MTFILCPLDGSTPHLPCGWQASVPSIQLALAIDPGQVRAAADELPPLSPMPLRDVSMRSACRIEQNVSTIASAVTAIRREEIQSQSWRTRSQALRDLAGFYIHNDRHDDLIGVRGTARPQNGNPRIPLLIGGQRTSDPPDDQAPVGMLSFSKQRCRQRSGILLQTDWQRTERAVFLLARDSTRPATPPVAAH